MSSCIFQEVDYTDLTGPDANAKVHKIRDGGFESLPIPAEYFAKREAHPQVLKFTQSILGGCHYLRRGGALMLPGRQRFEFIFGVGQRNF